VQLTVNGETIEYTLEGEKRLGQVVEGIERWLNANSLVVTSLRLGDRELASTPDLEWAEIPVEGVARLDVLARSPLEIEVEQVALMVEYYAQVEAGIAGGRPLAEATLADLPDVASLARLRLGLSAGSAGERALGELEADLKGATSEAVNSWPTGLRDRARRAAETLRTAAQARLAEIEGPAGALRATAGELETVAGQLADVALLLQTGRDEQAMRLLGRFAELLQAVLRMAGRRAAAGGTGLPQMAGGRSLETFVGEINAVLRQTIEAMGARDTVLLGDLLEYEAAPRVAELVTYLRGIEAR
jgi:hypothetical protein